MSDAAQTASTYNQQVYQRLKLSLSLDLRRQLYIAVCDDLNLRNRLAGQLHRELAKPRASNSQASDSPNQSTQNGSAQHLMAHGSFAYDAGMAERDLLVSLKLDLNDPNPIAQISHWLRKQTSPDVKAHMPGFQILGIEQLTRQPAAVQRLFLSYLRTLERHLPALNSSLLLWVTEPWYHNIRQSAPECWQWCSGLFEFSSEPLPLIPHEDIPQHSGIEHDLERESVQVRFPGKPAAPPQPAATAVQQARQSAQRLAEAAQAVRQTETPTETRTPAQPVQAEPVKAKVSQPPLTPPPVQASSSAQLRPPTEETQTQTEPQTQATSQAAPAPPADPTQPHKEAQTEEQQAPHQPSSTATQGKTPGTTADDLDTQIADQQEAKLLAHIETLRGESGNSEALALGYLELGRFYRQRMEQGDRSQDFIRYAIVAYEQVLEWLCFNDPGAETPNISWPDTLNDLGTLYWMASRQPESPEMGQSYLRLAIQTYRLGLKNTDPERQSRSYAMLQNNLGTVHSDQAHQQDPVENLQQAVTAYREALRFRQPDSAPQKYASTQNNLGTAYWHLAQHDNPPENLKEAIAAYSQAARYYSPEEQPDSYAMIQNNLGTAYWNLAQHSPAHSTAVLAENRSATGEDLAAAGENPAERDQSTFTAQDWLLLAVNAYNNALRFRTLQAAPSSYAATQNNLGTAYWQLANQAQGNAAAAREYLQLSVKAYSAALEGARFLRENGNAHLLNFDLNSTFSNLGLVHYQLATEYSEHLENGNQEEHLEHALTYHVQALDGWKQKPELHEAALEVLTQTVRKYYEIWGSAGQNRALAQVPGTLLPQLLPKL